MRPTTLRTVIPSYVSLCLARYSGIYLPILGNCYLLRLLPLRLVTFSLVNSSVGGYYLLSVSFNLLVFLAALLPLGSLHEFLPRG